MRNLLAGIVLVGGCGCAHATEWVNCAAPDGTASIDYLTGSLDVLNVSGLTITVGEKVWASDVAYGPGDPVAVGQAFESADSVYIDAVTTDMSARVAELRLFKASEGDTVAYAGTLRLPGIGAYPVTCSGPEPSQAD
jgi:hypothetical protein